MRYILFLISLCSASCTFGSPNRDSIYSFTIGTDVKITIDAPTLKKNKKVILILYDLPNGNTTAETMVKK